MPREPFSTKNGTERLWPLVESSNEKHKCFIYKVLFHPSAFDRLYCNIQRAINTRQNKININTLNSIKCQTKNFINKIKIY